MVVRLDRDMLIAGAITALLLLALGWRLKRAWQRFRLGRNRRRGARGEERAERLLERSGYVVVAWQHAGEGSFVVDGEVRTFALRADAVVTKDGRRLVVEVKTGAAPLDARATRRQLLEYAWTFAADGVLLVDVDAGRVHRVEFPGLGRPGFRKAE